jgi:DNA-binding MarR family transcriptional regulator
VLGTVSPLAHAARAALPIVGVRPIHSARLDELAARLSQSALRHGLTPRRHILLLMIKGAPDGSETSTVSELCGRLQLAQSTVTELVQRAEGAGLIRREQSEDDGRVAHLRLTGEGQRRLAAVNADLRHERETLAQALSELEQSF